MKFHCCQRLLTHPFVVFGVEFSEVDGDFVQFGLVNTVSRGGHVPMVQQDSAALVARYPDMHLKKIMKMNVSIWGSSFIIVHLTSFCSYGRYFVVNKSTRKRLKRMKIGTTYRVSMASDCSTNGKLSANDSQKFRFDLTSFRWNYKL